MKLGFARSPVGMIVILAASIFVAEVIVMLLLAALPTMPPLLANFLDAIILIVLAFPALHAFAFRPLLRQLRAREEAEKQLRAANQTLEQRTRELRNASEQRQLARQLEAEKARLVNAQAVAKVGSWETNLSTFAVTWSEETHRIFETNPATFQPSHQAFLALVHPADRAAVDEALARSIGQPGTQTIEHRLLMPGGRVKFVEERWQSFSDDQGRPLRALGTCQDISDRKRAEEALRESEDRFRALFENATDLIQIVSPDGHFLFVNRAWKTALGYADEDLSNLTVLNIVDESSKEHCTDAFRRLMNGEDVPGLEAVFVGKQGQRIAVEGSVNCRRVDGKPGNTRGIFRDVTERKRAEEALRENQARLDLALRSADMGVWHWDIIENKRYFDDQVCHLLGINPATFTGAAEEFLGALHPDDREKIKALLARTVEQDVPYEPEFRAVWPDGSAHYITARGRLVRDDKDRSLRIIGILWDITERKRAEQALVHAQELLNLTGQMGKIGGWELDLETQTLSWSDELYRMHEVDPATKLNVAEAINFYAPEARSVITAAVQAAIDSGTPWDLELPLITAQGQHIWVHAQGAAERRGGRTVRLRGAFQDITERKRLEAQVAETHQQLLVSSRQAGMAEVATSVLHNVGNVLNSVNVSATLVADHVRHSQAGNIAKLAALFDQHKADLTAFLTKDPRGRMIPDYLATLTESLATEQKTLITELDHLCKNIEHIKDVVAMQQSYAKTSGFIERVPLAELVEDALRMNASSLARHEVELVRDFQIRPVISTDQHKIMQILINLVRNAKLACDEAGRPDKRITVRIAGDAPWVRISVSDNGVGIPAENLTRIFNHGFTTRKTGHGFGLHSAALAAGELGGNLAVQSEGPGRGATFILKLPLNPDAPAHENSVR